MVHTVLSSQNGPAAPYTEDRTLSLKSGDTVITYTYDFGDDWGSIHITDIRQGNRASAIPATAPASATGLLRTAAAYPDSTTSSTSAPILSIRNTSPGWTTTTRTLRRTADQVCPRPHRSSTQCRQSPPRKINILTLRPSPEAYHQPGHDRGQPAKVHEHGAAPHGKERSLWSRHRMSEGAKEFGRTPASHFPQSRPVGLPPRDGAGLLPAHPGSSRQRHAVSLIGPRGGATVLANYPPIIDHQSTGKRRSLVTCTSASHRKLGTATA